MIKSERGLPAVKKQKEKTKQNKTASSKSSEMQLANTLFILQFVTFNRQDSKIHIIPAQQLVCNLFMCFVNGLYVDG